MLFLHRVPITQASASALACRNDLSRGPVSPRPLCNAVRSGAAAQPSRRRTRSSASISAVFLLLIAAVPALAQSEPAEPELPDLDEVAVSVRYREEQTLPRRFDYTLTISARAEGAESESLVQRESLWLDPAYRDWRRKFLPDGSAGMVTVFDKQFLTIASRTESRPVWGGTRRRGYYPHFEASTVYSVFYAGEHPISNYLTPASARVLGWSRVGDTPCVCIFARTPSHEKILDLDPELAYFPRRIAIVMDADAETAGAFLRRPIRSFPDGVEGGERFRVLAAFTIRPERVGADAYVPAEIDTVWVPDGAPVSKVTCEAFAEPPPGIGVSELGIPLVLDGSGVIGDQDSREKILFGAPSETQDTHLQQAALGAGEELKGTSPGERAGAVRWGILWTSVLAGVAAFALVVMLKARRRGVADE